MHIEFLAEDSSTQRLLEILIPRVLSSCGSTHSYRVHSYKGVGRIPANLEPTTDARKRILLDRLPRILKGYAKTPGIDAVVVVLDSDRNDCREYLGELHALAVQAGFPNTMFRLAIEETEAWYLGDREAIQAAYPNARLSAAGGYAQDSVCGTWELLADMIHPGGRTAVQESGWPLPGTLKHEWADRIGPRLALEGNSSPSFNKLIEGLQRILSQV